MDKNAIKKYAIWAQRELIARVSQKAQQYGISEENTGDIHAESINGRLLSEVEQEQRTALIVHIHENGFRQVMEEVAYTWFNRFCALRFMEVNNYLPTRIRVFTDEDNAFKPQILTEAIHMEMDGLDMEKVYAFKEKNETEELYKYLFITQCNALSAILPGMFQQIEDYTELLLPDNLLREGSVIEQMIALIPEEDWQDQVQIIGWLYQYYNAEPKDQVFANLKKNIKIGKNDIPAATQLFTPDWIVRYMVENSLGRLWVEGHPDDGLKAGWRYYLEEAEQDPEVQAQLAKLRAEYAVLKPEDIKCIDPCMGSGHILVYMFDVLMQIYEAYGYSTREAVQSILENNLYGLDIDDRAAQLAYFAVMMKARQYDRRFFTRGIQPHVCAIQVGTRMLEQNWSAFGAEEGIVRRIHAAFVDAKEYGSLICPDVTPEEIHALRHRMVQMQGLDPNTMSLGQLAAAMAAIDVIAPLVEQVEMLCRKYDVVVTNPPYMGASNMGDELSKFVKDNYPDSKSDLFAVFIERCRKMTKQNGYQAMITQHAWMFLSSFEKLRAKLLNVDTVNMAHLGARAFEEIGGEVVQTTSFVLRKSHVNGYQGTYCRLIEPTTQQGKEDMFLAGQNRYVAQQDNFTKIPGAPVAYWVSTKTLYLFSQKRVSDYFDSRVGLMTTNNDRFLRLFWEVDVKNICFSAHNDMDCSNSDKTWFPHNKGGAYRKWAGNREYIVDWWRNGEHIKQTAIQKYPYLNGNPNFVVHDDGYYFHESVSWSEIAIGNLAFRYYPDGFTFNVKGMSTFKKSSVSLYSVLGFANTKVATYLGHILNPSISFGVNSFGNLPYIPTNQTVETLAKDNVNLSTADWDSFETSWDFQRHPLLQYATLSPQQIAEEERNGYLCLNTMEEAYRHWEQVADERFQQLKSNEEELNRIFIDIYGLQDELTPEVEDKDVTVRRADLGRDVRSFISYAVGCMFGRYSIYKPGLMFAGGKWDPDAFEHTAWESEGKPEALEFYHNEHFLPDADGILPITDDEYFDDDIVGRFVQFVETVYGRGTLEENLKFIAGALGGSGTPRQVIRSYFLNDFYADHLKIYQKRPIYWLFDSGKKNGFKCLIYMHRYAPDTIARIRTDYVHEQQSRYRTAIEDLEKRVASAATTAERVKLTKQLTKIKAQAEELRLYEEKIHHLADQMIPIDLDDGVKVNYAKFADVLAKIK